MLLLLFRVYVMAMSMFGVFWGDSSDDDTLIGKSSMGRVKKAKKRKYCSCGDREPNPNPNSNLLYKNPMTDNLDLGDKRIINLANPKNVNDGVNKDYVDTLHNFVVAKYPLWDMNAKNHRIRNVPEPLEGGDVANKYYVDDQSFIKRFVLAVDESNGFIDLGNKYNFINARQDKNNKDLLITKNEITGFARSKKLNEVAADLENKIENMKTLFMTKNDFQNETKKLTDSIKSVISNNVDKLFEDKMKIPLQKYLDNTLTDEKMGQHVKNYLDKYPLSVEGSEEYITRDELPDELLKLMKLSNYGANLSEITNKSSENETNEGVVKNLDSTPKTPNETGEKSSPTNIGEDKALKVNEIRNDNEEANNKLQEDTINALREKIKKDESSKNPISNRLLPPIENQKEYELTPEQQHLIDRIHGIKH